MGLGPHLVSPPEDLFEELPAELLGLHDMAYLL